MRLAIAAGALGLLLVATGCNSTAARPTRSPSPAGEIASPTASPAALPSPSPPLDKAVDLTWISDQTGWALTDQANLFKTADGGASWKLVGRVPGSDTHVRFADATHAYLFGGEASYYESLDGGRDWQHEQDVSVEDVEPSGDRVYRLIYDHGGCPGPCTRTVQMAAPGSNTWRTLLTIPTSAYISRAGRAQVIASGADVYVPIYGDLAAGAGAQQMLVYRSQDYGSSWSRIADPCGNAGGHIEDGIALAASHAAVGVLCAPRLQQGAEFLTMSRDAGTTWRRSSLSAGSVRSPSAPVPTSPSRPGQSADRAVTTSSSIRAPTGAKTGP